MTRLYTFIIISFVSFSCDEVFEEKTGLCASRDGLICKKGVSENLCNQYMAEMKDDKEWIFYEGNNAICPPVNPLIMPTDTKMNTRTEPFDTTMQARSLGASSN
jgi:hypothetical protein